MFATILAWLGSFLGGPFITGALAAYKAKLASDNSTEKIAADLASREIDIQQRELELQSQLRIAEIGHWYEPDHLFGYIMVIFFGKVVIWDKVLGWGTTDAIKGDVATWAGLIMVFYFGKRGFENIARILKR